MSSTSSRPAATARRNAGEGATKAAAVGLWVLIGGGLLYGVVQTAIRAAQLFT